MQFGGKELKSRFDEVRRQIKKAAEEANWYILEAEEYNTIWNRFEEKFNFRPSTEKEHWPSITEPTPSLTFDLSDFSIVDANKELGQFYIDAFMQIGANRDWIYALDWNHTCYRFKPIDNIENTSSGNWPITPYPNGDYYIFLSQDLCQGFFGHPWEQSLCVFGSDFLSCLQSHDLTCLQKIMRKNSIEVKN